MRLDEFVTRYTDGEVVRVVDATPAELHLGRQLAHLPGSSVVRVEEAGPLADDDLLVAYIAVEDGSDLRTDTEKALAGLPAGGRAVLIVARPPGKLPAGPVVDALTAGGFATAGATGLGVGTGLTSIALSRPVDPQDLSSLGSIRSYPDGRPVVGPGSQAWLRLLAERAVEGAVTRAREERLAWLEREVTALTTRLNAATATKSGAAKAPSAGGSRWTPTRVRAKAGRELGKLRSSMSGTKAADADDSSD